MKFQSQLISLLLLINANKALAVISPDYPSIQYNSDTLPQKKIEVGPMAFSYGLTNAFTVSIPVYPLIFESYSIAAKFKIPVEKRMKLSFVGSLGVYDSLFSLSAGANFQYDVSPKTRLNFGLIGGYNQYSNTFRGLDKVIKGASSTTITTSTTTSTTTSSTASKSPFSVLVNVNFDYYTPGGNLFYIGTSFLFPYVGFTWSLGGLQFGFVASLLMYYMYIPAPYLYWRS